MNETIAKILTRSPLHLFTRSSAATSSSAAPPSTAVPSPMPPVAARARVAGSFLHVGLDNDADGFFPRHDVADRTPPAAARTIVLIIVGIEIVSFGSHPGEFFA
jgi:hypothetical protein